MGRLVEKNQKELQKENQSIKEEKEDLECIQDYKVF